MKFEHITAIKECRAATGLGLKEAKDFIDAYRDYVANLNDSSLHVHPAFDDNGRFEIRYPNGVVLKMRWSNGQIIESKKK